MVANERYNPNFGYDWGRLARLEVTPWRHCRCKWLFDRQDLCDALDTIQSTLPQVPEATNRVPGKHQSHNTIWPQAEIAFDLADMIIVTLGTLLSIRSMTLNGKVGCQYEPKENIYLSNERLSTLSAFHSNRTWRDGWITRHNGDPTLVNAFQETFLYIFALTNTLAHSVRRTCVCKDLSTWPHGKWVRPRESLQQYIKWVWEASCNSKQFAPSTGMIFKYQS